MLPISQKLKISELPEYSSYSNFISIKEPDRRRVSNYIIKCIILLKYLLQYLVRMDQNETGIRSHPVSSLMCERVTDALEEGIPSAHR